MRLAAGSPILEPVVAPVSDVPAGSWSRDGHTASPMAALAASAYVDAFNAGFAEGFTQWGILAQVRNAVIGGWLYGGFAPLVDGDEAARRIERRLALPGLDEHEASARRWLDILVPEAERRRRALAEGFGELTDDELAARVDAIGAATRDVVRRRFADTAIYELVAEYVLQAGEVAGSDPATALAALARSAGTPTASTATTAAVADLAAEVAAEPRLASRLPDVGLDELRAVPAASRALDELLGRDGDLPVDTDLAAPTLTERPDVVVALVAGLLRVEGATRVARTPVDDRLADIADRALAGHEWRERTAALLLRHFGLLRRAALELGRRLTAAGRLDAPEHALDLTVEELASSWTTDHRGLAAPRAVARSAAADRPPPPLLGDPPAPPPDLELPGSVARAMARIGWYASTLSSPSGPPAAPNDDGMVSGVGAAPGRAEGVARVVHGIDELVRIRPSDVLVCATTTPAWTAALAVAAAVVCDEGGLTSHPALIARELGIPAVVGTKVATRALPDGAVVVVDGSIGTVRPT